MGPAHKELKTAIATLRRDPSARVRAEVEGLTVEIRAVADEETNRKSAADIFEEAGPWEGETAEEIAKLLADARSRGSARWVEGL